MKTISKQEIVQLIELHSRISDFIRVKASGRWKRNEKKAYWAMRSAEIELAVKLSIGLKEKVDSYDLTYIAELALKNAEPVEAYIKILYVLDIGVERENDKQTR